MAKKPAKAPSTGDLNQRVEKLEKAVGGELTERQSRFVEAYARCGVGAEAAVQAGYTQNRLSARVTAHHLLRMPHVQAALEVERAELARKLEINDEFVLGNLKELAVSGPPATRVRANDLLAKIRRMYEENVSVTVLTPEQRAARVAALLAKGAERATEGGEKT